MPRPSKRGGTWTVLGVGGTVLHVAAVLPGDVTRELATPPKPNQWAHVVKARTATDAETWARETYADHVAGLLSGDAEVSIEIVTSAGPKTPWSLGRWRRRKGK